MHNLARFTVYVNMFSAKRLNMGKALRLSLLNPACAPYKHFFSGCRCRIYSIPSSQKLLLITSQNHRTLEQKQSSVLLRFQALILKNLNNLNKSEIARKSCVTFIACLSSVSRILQKAAACQTSTKAHCRQNNRQGLKTSLDKWRLLFLLFLRIILILQKK